MILDAALKGLSETEQLNLTLEAERQIYRKSLYATAKHLLGYHDVNPHTHGDMIAALEDPETLRKLIVMPRGTFKTSLSTVAYPIWRLINDPNLRILLDSEVYTNSKNMLREIKGHLESERFTRVFGPWKSREVWNEGEILVKTRSLVRKEATITCSGIGAQKTGQHYDLIIADDMNSPKNSNTPENCEKVIQHYRYYTSLLDPGKTLVIVGTRYSANDLIGHIIRNVLGGIPGVTDT